MIEFRFTLGSDIYCQILALAHLCQLLKVYSNELFVFLKRHFLLAAVFLGVHNCLNVLSAAERLALPKDTIISYWKPEVAVKIVNDFSQYPRSQVPPSVHRNLVVYGGVPFYKPAIYVDEIGLTTDKYIPLSNSTEQVPLRISFGPLSVQRWLLMAVIEESLHAQTNLGFSARDLDDVRR
jgi:hypothetical protein